MIRRSLARVPTLSTSTWAALTVVAWALVVGQFAIDGAGGIVVGAAGLALHLAEQGRPAVTEPRTTAEHLAAAAEQLRAAAHVDTGHATVADLYAQVGELQTIAIRADAHARRIARQVAALDPDRLYAADDAEHGGDPRHHRNRAFRDIRAAAEMLGVVVSELGDAHSALGHLGTRQDRP